MTNSEQVLLESQAARSFQLAKIEDRAEELLSKAKALHFNVWQGTGIATTEQVAEFYEVPIKTIETVLQRNREEFNSDGLRTITSKELKELKMQTLTMKVCQIVEELKPHSGFDLGRYTKSLLVWNPRATLRLGYLLRDSVIAKAVRTTSLDFIEKAPQQVTQPKSQAEMLLIYAQQFFEHEQRLKSVEADVQEMKQIRVDATQQLDSAALPPAGVEAPMLATRRALLHAVNLYCQKTSLDQKEAWNRLYEQLRLRCGFSVKKRGHLKNETHLDVVVRHGYLAQTYAIALDYFGLQCSKPTSLSEGGS